jgi:hypothetical protein
MKDPSDNIRDWLYNVMLGTITYGGDYIPVYSFPPRDAAMPYIVIGEQMMSGEDESTKDSWLTEHEVTIEVWDSYTGNDGSYVKVNSIANDILELIRTRSLTVTGSGGESIAGITGWTVVRLTAEAMLTDRFLWDNNIIIYKSLNIRLLLEES